MLLAFIDVSLRVTDSILNGRRVERPFGIIMWRSGKRSVDLRGGRCGRRVVGRCLR